MAKVTEQDVVNFLKEKVAQLTKDLEAAQGALIALQGSSRQEGIAAGRKPNAAGTTLKRKIALKPGRTKTGRKKKVKDMPSERILVADQLG